MAENRTGISGLELQTQSRNFWMGGEQVLPISPIIFMQRIEMENRIYPGVRYTFRHPQNPTAVIPMVERRSIKSERKIWHRKYLNFQLPDEIQKSRLSMEPPKVFQRLVWPWPSEDDSGVAPDT
jgi:hypothetical protein